MYRTDSTAEGGYGGAPGATRQARVRRMSAQNRALKRALDIAGALFVLTVFLPLYIAVAIGVWRSSPGAIIYSQLRAGLGGRNFRFFKFRSMVEDSEEVLSSFLDSDEEARARWAQYQKLPDDPRITAFGRFIRRSSLDELPQFWNVLKGDMSLVGPRPCLLEQQALYGAHWDAYCAVKPGLTGLWQVSGRNRLTYQQRVRLDARYVSNWSVWLDLKILARTVGVVLRADGSQ